MITENSCNGFYKKVNDATNYYQITIPVTKQKK